MKMFIESETLSQFKKRFGTIFGLVLLIIIFILWGAFYHDFQRNFKNVIRGKAQSFIGSYEYIVQTFGAEAGEKYLVEENHKNPELLSFIKYDSYRDRLVASNRPQLIGKSLENLSPGDQQLLRSNILDREDFEELYRRRNSYHYVAARNGQIFIVNLEDKRLFQSFFTTSLILELGILILVFLIMTFPIGFIARKVMHPFIEKVAEIRRAFPLRLGKLLNSQNQKESLQKGGILSFLKEFGYELEDILYHQQWVNYVYEQLPIGLLFSDKNGNVVYGNSKMTELLGISPELLLSEGWGDYIFPEDRSSVLENWSKAIREQTLLEFQARFRTSDGFVNWVHCQASPIRDLNDQAIGAVATFVPINHLKRLEKQQKDNDASQPDEHQDISFKEAMVQRKKSDLITIISHQLRTPLSVIHEAIEILDQVSKDQGPEYKDFLNVCRNNVNKIIGMIHDILDFEEIEFNLKKWKFEAKDLNETTKRCFEKRKIFFEEKGVSFDLEVSPDPLIVTIDEGSLCKAIDNLISNALHFTENGRVVIRTFQKEGKGVMEIEDTGIGIRKEDISSLFTLFTQIHSSNMRFGSGLGLVIVQKIIERHQGEITFETEFGKGSTFRLTIPLKENKK